MAVFRINKTENYTVMCNYHFKDRNLSLKAKGLLSLMLSLPDEWDYSIEGLIAICKENETAIKSILKELKDHNYLIIRRCRSNFGRFDYEYDIYEKPYSNLPEVENPPTVKPPMEEPQVEEPEVENQGQLNTNILNTNKLNTKRLNTNNKPTLEEIENYVKEKDLNVNAKDFFEYFETGNWIDSKGNKVKNWKQKLLTWNKYQGNKQKNNQSGWDYISQEMEKLF